MKIFLREENEVLAFREVKYVAAIPSNIKPVLVGDIGGTNCNFGIFYHVDHTHVLLLSIHFKSKEITSFEEVVKQVLAYLKLTYNLTITSACFASAGVVSAKRDFSKPTNLKFMIDIPAIVKNTDLECVLLANDFEVIGYGLALIDPKDLVLVNSGVPQEGTNKAIVGAGTGLGKCILLWEKDREIYVPVASEGGHADFASQSALEYELVSYIKKVRNSTCNVSWEDVLSGSGIQLIYNFFCSRNAAIKSNELLAKEGLHPDEIFNSRFLDEHAWNTFELYALFYARCAKNFALDSLARGGVYIAGGIAAKNLMLFEQDSFLTEFINCGKQQEVLKKIPIYVITDYNVSLYGAAEYMRVEGVCDL